MKLKLTIFVLSLISILLFWTFYQKNVPQRIILEIGVFSGSPYEVPNAESYRFIDETIKLFEKSHPNIKIKYQSGTLKSDYSEWLSERILKGDIPDIFVIPSGDFNDFSSIGVLKNLSPIIAKDKTFNKKMLYSNAISMGQFSGKQFALPIELDPVLMFVNKTLLAKEKIDMPKGDWTWDNFYNICSKVTKDTNSDGKIDQFGVVDFTWQNAVYGNGQTLFDEDGKSAHFDNPHVVEAVNFVKNLNSLNQNTPVSIDDFNAGRVAFKPFPFSWYKVYKSYPYKLIRYADFDWECISPPKGPLGKNATLLNSILYGISVRTNHEKESWEFLKYLSYNSEIQMNLFKYSNGLPVLRSVTESNQADTELRKYNPEEKVSLNRKELSNVIENSFVIPKFNKYDNAMNRADLAIYKMISENQDIGTELEKLNYDINTYLNE